MNHKASTAAWVALFLFLAGFYAGVAVGDYNSSARRDATRIEARLRQVFCEQAVRNKIVSTCMED